MKEEDGSNKKGEEGNKRLQEKGIRGDSISVTAQNLGTKHSGQLPRGIFRAIRSSPQLQVTALHLELSTLAQTFRSRFPVSQLSQLRASTASHRHPRCASTLPS